MQAYLATDSEGSGQESDGGGAEEDEDAIRERYRRLLLGGDADVAAERQGKKDWGAGSGSEDGESGSEGEGASSGEEDEAAAGGKKGERARGKSDKGERAREIEGMRVIISHVCRTCIHAANSPTAATPTTGLPQVARLPQRLLGCTACGGWALRPPPTQRTLHICSNCTSSIASLHAFAHALPTAVASKDLAASPSLCPLPSASHCPAFPPSPTHPDMEMEVTFLPGLENLGERLLAKKREEEARKGETVWEAYMRRKR